jgi:hypothetical protein
MISSSGRPVTRHVPGTRAPLASGKGRRWRRWPSAPRALPPERSGSKSGPPNKNNKNPKQVVENEELLIGDIVTLLSFCTVKQIDAIVTAPDFPGWTAPLEFRYERWIEFSSFLIATIATFTTVSFLTGGYARSQSSSMSRLVENCAFVSFITCLMLASQLVIGVASENASFVGLSGWDEVLPLAARGIGEPWVTAAQIIGVTTGWRVIWYFFVDTSSFLKLGRLNAYKETERGVLEDAAKCTAALMVTSLVLLRLLQSFFTY